MKQKLKNYLKIGVLLFGIASIFNACQKDYLHKEIEEELTIKSPPKLTATIENGTELLNTNRKLFDHLNEKFNNNNTLRTINSSEYGFSIDTTVIQKVETSAYKSFTFIVKRDYSDENILENYVYTDFNDGTYQQHVIAYPILINESQQSFDIENATIQPINDSSLIYSRGNGGCASLVEYEEPVCTYTKCAENEHSLNVDGWQNCIYWGLGYGQPTMSCTEGAWVDQGCPDSNGGTGTGTGSGTGGGGSSNNNQGSGEEDEDIVVVPLDSSTFTDEENCDKLNNLLDENISNIRPSLELLEGTLDQNGENGVQFKKTGLGNYSAINLPPTTTNSISFASGGDNYAGAHTHPLRLHPMFSWSDVYTLFNLYFRGSVNVKDEVSFMVMAYETAASAQATIYAITVKDFITFRDKINQDLNGIVASRSNLTMFSPIKDKIDALNEELGKEFDKDIDNMPRAFLKSFESHGISLYKANDDITNWIKLDMGQSILNNETVIEIPCN